MPCRYISVMTAPCVLTTTLKSNKRMTNRDLVLHKNMLQTGVFLLIGVGGTIEWLLEWYWREALCIHVSLITTLCVIIYSLYYHITTIKTNDKLVWDITMIGTDLVLLIEVSIVLFVVARFWVGQIWSTLIHVNTYGYNVINVSWLIMQKDNEAVI